MAGFDAGNIDETIHGRLRLGIMAYLESVSSASFPELANVLEATNGNLSVHLRKLEEAGYIQIEKDNSGRRPTSQVHISEDGRAAWSTYLEALKPLFGG